MQETAVGQILQIIFSHDVLLTLIAAVAAYYLKRMQSAFEKMGERQNVFNEQLIKIESRIISEVEIIKVKTHTLEKQLDRLSK